MPDNGPITVHTIHGACELYEQPGPDFLAGCGSASVLAFQGERVVMVRNRVRGWEFPGGKCEQGETPEECVRREALEEGGLDLFGLQALCGFKHFLKDGRVFTGMFYAATAEGFGEPLDSGEISEVAAFDTLPAGLSYDDDLTRAMHELGRRRGHRIPRWAKSAPPVERGAAATQQVLQRERLHTVCRSAACPNRGECYAHGTATYLIMGDRCTRNCRFCAVEGGAPLPLDPDEPARLASASRQLGLEHVVITSVTRDDLSDGGAGHFAECIRALRRELPSATVEVLTSDFQGNEMAVARVLAAEPDVFNHNVETVPRLYGTVRPRADYRRSLDVLRRARQLMRRGAVKSGLMVGLGERPSEVLQVLSDLREAGCDVVTIGQYLRPSPLHLPVREYVCPGRFEYYRIEGEKMGFAAVCSGPLVRSSYNAAEAARACGLR